MLLLLFLPAPTPTPPEPADSNCWVVKDKIEQVTGGEILTPDGQLIMVGRYLTEVLRYEDGVSNWSTKTKDDTC